MKAKLLKKFRKRFSVRTDNGQLVLIDLYDQKVYDNFVPGHKIPNLQAAIYLGVSKIIGIFELMDYWEDHKKRIHKQRIRKLL